MIQLGLKTMNTKILKTTFTVMALLFTINVFVQTKEETLG